MTSVVVLGASGMLGSMVVDVLAGDGRLQVAGTVRTPRLAAECRELLPEVVWREVDAAADGRSLAAALDGADWVINAIGLTKPYVHDDDPAEVERAIRVNAAFPFALAKAADATGAQVVQIATDCVYSGSAGRYVESAPHDPLDVYGKTKSLGEAGLPGMHLLRCSIVGPEPAAPTFLLEWLRRQPPGASVNGYVDHLWNGVTTYAFARLCLGLATGGASAPHLQHVVPDRDVTKADLLVMIAKAYGRDDITVVPAQAPHPVDRTLRTEQAEANTMLWAAAGYATPPSVAEMIAEMAKHTPRLSGLAP
jgi:dTDP-4-dehydrorhamnose reductase